MAGAGLKDVDMRQGTARRPSTANDPVSPRQPEAGRGAESADFLETAAIHLREAGYTVELEFDHEADEAYLYVDGIEVHFVRTLPPKKPVKH